MADNISLRDGSGAIVSTDDVDGVQVLRCKLQFGADGVATDVEEAAPLPVVLSGQLPTGGNVLGRVELTSLPELPAGANHIGDVGVTSLPNVTIGSALPAGSNNVGKVDVASLPALPAGSNTIGSVSLSPAYAGGLKTLRAVGLGVTAKSAKGGKQVFGWYLSNTGTSVAFVKLYETETPTVGTTVPIATFMVPVGAVVTAEMTNGIAVASGFAIAATTGVSDTDRTAPGTNAVVANIFYS